MNINNNLMKYFKKKTEGLQVKKKPTFHWIKKNDPSQENICNNIPSATKNTPTQKSVFTFNLKEAKKIGEKQPEFQDSVVKETLQKTVSDGQVIYKP